MVGLFQEFRIKSSIPGYVQPHKTQATIPATFFLYYQSPCWKWLLIFVRLLILSFLPYSYGTLFLACWICQEGASYTPRTTYIILHNFFPPTRPIYLLRHLHQRQTLGFCTFIQTWSIRSWVKVTEFANLKSWNFFFLYLLSQLERIKPEKYCYFRAC